MRRLIVLAVVSVVVLLLVVGQLVLPGIATDRLRDQLAKHGRVLHVEVHAFPAVQLLWHHADRVVIRMGSYNSSSTNLGTSLGQANDVGELDASAQTVTAGLLTIRDAALRGRDGRLSATARVNDGDLRAAVPFLDSVQPLASGNGQLTLRGTATVLGVTATADATVAAVDGKLQVQPDVPFGGLATVTVFSDPHVHVDGVSATSFGADAFTVTGSARVR